MLPTDDELLDRLHNRYRPSIESGQSRNIFHFTNLSLSVDGVFLVPRHTKQPVKTSAAQSAGNQPAISCEGTNDQLGFCNSPIQFNLPDKELDGPYDSMVPSIQPNPTVREVTCSCKHMLQVAQRVPMYPSCTCRQVKSQGGNDGQQGHQIPPDADKVPAASYDPSRRLRTHKTPCMQTCFLSY